LASNQENTMNTTLRLAALSMLAIVAAWTTAPHANAQSVAVAKNRVVIQVSDAEPAKWQLALNNARNIQADLGAANVEIEIVAYGPGLGMLKRDSAAATRVEEALTSGVKVFACGNTMRAQKLTQPDMLPSISYVEAGVVEIMQKQQQGWAYIKP
jgi:intracellular sulfur oxidation DsrE/DsrF family protein